MEELRRGPAQGTVPQQSKYPPSPRNLLPSFLPQSTPTLPQNLPPPPHSTCTWLSTDGGVTWKDVAEGSYIYEFADWGSTIFMAQHPGLMAMPTSTCWGVRQS